MTKALADFSDQIAFKTRHEDTIAMLAGDPKPNAVIRPIFDLQCSPSSYLEVHNLIPRLAIEQSAQREGFLRADTPNDCQVSDLAS